MSSIAFADRRTPFNPFYCCCTLGWASPSGRLGHFPDVKISKRPNDLLRIFLSGLGRSGRSGRLSSVSYWEGKRTCFFPYVDRIGKHVLNVRTSGNASNHISPSPRNRKATPIVATHLSLTELSFPIHDGQSVTNPDRKSSHTFASANVSVCRHRCTAFECYAQHATKRVSGPTAAPRCVCHDSTRKPPADGSSPQNHRVLGLREQPRGQSQFVCFVRTM